MGEEVEGGIWLTHKVVTRPAVNLVLAQDRESSPARTGGLTTMLCHSSIDNSIVAY